jgi:hypothetical protein
MAMLAMGALTGCGPKRLRADFRGFEMAYADTSNQEVLLNLARLQNRDPTYFFKLGQISSSYRLQATLTGNGNYINSGTLPGYSNVNGGGTPGLLMENDPAFTFVPVNDDTNAQLLLKPIPAETFFGLYQQGWRLDQLFRLMVDRIEWRHQDTSGECVVDEFRNVPPMVYTVNGQPDTSYSRDQDQLSRYATFLRVAAVAYALQKHGHLVLRGKNVFTPYDTNGYPVADPKPVGDTKPANGAPLAKDIADAAAKGDGWEKNEAGQWIFGHISLTPVFYLSPSLTTTGDTSVVLGHIQSELLKDPDFSGLKDGDAMKQVLGVVATGFSIQGNTSIDPAEEKSCSAPPHLYLRSLLGLMAAAAQEEQPFESVMAANPVIEKIPGGVTLNFRQAVPAIESQPALRLNKTAEADADKPLVVIPYKGKLYQIADVASPDQPENQYWNRDMFRLTTQLTSQVTVDISKFPLPETLQIHQ